MKFVYVILLLISGCLLQEQSSNEESSHKGSLSPKLIFKQNSSGNLVVPSKVDLIRFTITGSQGYEKVTEFSYNQGTAEIQDIPIGLVNLTIEAIDVFGEAIFRADITMEIEVGKTLKPEVTLVHTRPIFLSLLSPQNGDTVNTSNITLSGILEVYYELLSFNIEGKSKLLSGNEWNETFTLNEGKNDIDFLIIDRNTNVLDTTLSIFYIPGTIDNIGPILSINQYQSFDTVSVGNLVLTGSVLDPSGVTHVSINSQNANISGNSWILPLSLNAGENQIVIQALDVIGNITSDTLTLIYDENAQDIIAPYLSIDFPLNNSIITSNKVSVKGVANDINGIYSVTVNGDSIEVMDNGQWVKLVNLVVGENLISVRATDNSAERNNTLKSITVFREDVDTDTIPPIIEFSSPTNNQTIYNSPFLVVGTAIDASGIDSIKVNGTMATFSNGTWNISLTPQEEGLISITAIAWDTWGNSDTTEININHLIKPEITITSEIDGDTVNSNTGIVITGISSDNIGVTAVRVNGIEATLTDSNWTATINLENGGENIIYAVAEDAAGSLDTASLTLYYIFEYGRTWSSQSTSYAGLNVELADISIYQDQFFMVYRDEYFDANVMQSSGLSEAGIVGSPFGREFLQRGTIEYLSINIYQGTPYVSFDHSNAEPENTGAAYFNGTEWVGYTNVPVDGIIEVEFDDEGGVYLGGSGAPEFPGQIRMSWLNGNNWTGLNARQISPNYVEYFSFTVPSPKNIILCWSDFQNNDRMYFAKHNGSTWSEPMLMVPNRTSYLEMEHYNNEPYVIYRDGGNDLKLSMKRFDGSSWKVVGEEGFSTSDARFPAFTFYQNEIYVVYSDNTERGKIKIMRFDGKKWNYLPDLPKAPANIEKLDISVYEGKLFVSSLEAANGILETHLILE